jgi:simple sugar transport system ATP-binding protein
VTYADEVIVLRDRAHVITLRGDAITVPAVLSTIAAESSHVA